MGYFLWVWISFVAINNYSLKSINYNILLIKSSKTNNQTTFKLLSSHLKIQRNFWSKFINRTQSLPSLRWQTQESPFHLLQQHSYSFGWLLSTHLLASPLLPDDYWTNSLKNLPMLLLQSTSLKMTYHVKINTKGSISDLKK